MACHTSWKIKQENSLDPTSLTSMIDYVCVSAAQPKRQHTAYMIHNVTHGHECEVSRALVALAFGPDDSLGTIVFESRSPMAMSEYLRRVSLLSSSKSRKFLASDGEEYQWSWRSTKGHEWTCTGQGQQLIATYTLKVVGEPDYISSSGCVLTIDEAYPHLAVEILATLTIMRHIVAHNL